MQQTSKLVEDTLHILSRRRDPSQNEREEHVLLVLLFAIVKSKGVQTDIPDQLQECLKRFGLPVIPPPCDNSLGGTSDVSSPRWIAWFYPILIPGNKQSLNPGVNLETYAPTPKSFTSADIDMVSSPKLVNLLHVLKCEGLWYRFIYVRLLSGYSVLMHIYFIHSVLGKGLGCTPGSEQSPLSFPFSRLVFKCHSTRQWCGGRMHTMHASSILCEDMGACLLDGAKSSTSCTYLSVT